MVFIVDFPVDDAVDDAAMLRRCLKDCISTVFGSQYSRKYGDKLATLLTSVICGLKQSFLLDLGCVCVQQLCELLSLIDSRSNLPSARHVCVLDLDSNLFLINSTSFVDGLSVYDFVIVNVTKSICVCKDAHRELELFEKICKLIEECRNNRFVH